MSVSDPHRTRARSVRRREQRRTDPTPLQAAARYGGLIRQGVAPDDPVAVEARAELAAATLEKRVRAILADAPPLSKAQIARVVGILRSGA